MVKHIFIKSIQQTLHTTRSSPINGGLQGSHVKPGPSVWRFICGLSLAPSKQHAIGLVLSFGTMRILVCCCGLRQ